METFQAIVLGCVQGLTEFLPISSSAHLVILPWLFHWEDPGLAFDVFLHLGTLLALLGYFFKDWLGLAQAGIGSIIDRRIGFDRDRQIFWFLVCASVPGALGGYLFHDLAEEAFRSPLLIAVALAGVGFVMYWVDASFPGLKKIDELNFKNALLIGVAQAFAIIPGVSRSGSTITMGRLVGLSREAAARFSFLMAFPITLGACLFEFRKLTHVIGSDFPLTYCLAGLISSALVGIVSIHGMLIYLRGSGLKVFAWYRLALAILIIIVSIGTRPH
ncbi:MAG: undecaprenyl-diphosphate phosphatase [Deltaproteobacteria bacterium]|nr:undecaprenyl-diphosphate phosphatase [Deltaproteobacteria bacterium]MBI3293443.1 undecaprenyl-diphosphate phosphatase [Deltaproteobacteria bacterium]